MHTIERTCPNLFQTILPRSERTSNSDDSSIRCVITLIATILLGGVHYGGFISLGPWGAGSPRQMSGWVLRHNGRRKGTPKETNHWALEFAKTNGVDSPYCWRWGKASSDMCHRVDGGGLAAIGKSRVPAHTITLLLTHDESECDPTLLR